MPTIDVSQASYRTLLSAAHSRGMSIDRCFIRRHLTAPGSTPPGPAGTTGATDGTAGKLANDRRPAAPARQHAAVPGSQAGAERAATAAGAGTSTGASFEALWGRIERNTGVGIVTMRGQGFTYDIEAGYLAVRGGGARVPRGQFKKALGQWPTDGPSKLRGVYAASVVWAVLADRRILGRAA